MSESLAAVGNSQIAETMSAVIGHGPENYQLEPCPFQSVDLVRR